MPSETICEAIRERRVARLRYGRNPARGFRTIHPHAVFRASTGHLYLDAYQVGGYSSTGALPMWRLFDLDRMWTFKAGDERFTPDPGFNPANRERHRDVRCQVALETVDHAGPR